jgi:hypothetical protein
VQISASGEDAGEADVALDAQGNAAALWLRFDEKSKVILAEAAGYDAAGPGLNALTIPASGTVGQPLSFSVSPFDVWSALGATTWSFGDGASSAGASVAHAYAASGTYTVTVTSLDSLGNPSSAQSAVAISAAPPPPIACGCVEVVLAPKITNASVTHARFRVSKRATALSAKAKAKAPQGTAFRFSLSEPAAVKIVIQRSSAGLRNGGRCVAPSAKLRRRHARRCSRTVALGTLTRARENQGKESIAFSGRLGSKPLSPGAYKAILTAAAAGVISAPVTLTFTVVA